MIFRMRPWSWWKERMVEGVLALFLFYVISSLVQHRREIQREQLDPAEWFTIREIFVPDHVRGSDPLMVYDRVVKEDFTGFWIAEVQRRDLEDGFFNACTGSGSAQYTTEDMIPEEGVRWSWFLYRPCVVDPGTYRVVVTYDLRVPGYPVKRLVAYSNVFEVLPEPSP